MKDNVTKVLTTLLLAALVTTLVMPRSQGQSPGKVLEGLFQTAVRSTNATLGRKL